MGTHDIYRDWLAVRTGSEIEKTISAGRMDVFKMIPADLQKNLPNRYQIVDIKCSDSGEASGVGQLGGYRDYFKQIDPGCEVQLRVHIVLPASLRARSQKIAVLQKNTGFYERSGIEITTEIERPNLSPAYRAGGLTFDSAQALRLHLALVKRDFLVMNFLSPPHESFLRDLASAWRRVDRGQPAYDVKVSESQLGGMMMSVHGRVVSPDDCVRPLMMLAHYELLSEPLAA